MFNRLDICNSKCHFNKYGLKYHKYIINTYILCAYGALRFARLNLILKYILSRIHLLEVSIRTPKLHLL